jgi:hypothetical protein
MTSLILDHIAKAFLYLEELVRRERYNLDIVQGQDYISLDIVIRLIKTSWYARDPYFVDHSLNLIISFLDSQASLVITTTNTCSLNSASSLLSLDSLRLA